MQNHRFIPFALSADWSIELFTGCDLGNLFLNMSSRPVITGCEVIGMLFTTSNVVNTICKMAIDHSIYNEKVHGDFNMLSSLYGEGNQNNRRYNAIHPVIYCTLYNSTHITHHNQEVEASYIRF